MIVFSDLHHAGLYYSFHLLFEKRLGFSLFRPAGLEWFERGFWDVAKPYQNDINTVKQYLSLQSGYTPVDGSPPLNQVVHRNSSMYSYRMRDVYHDYEQRALTFQQFLETDIDIIIASIPDHYVTYKRLRDQFKPKAKLICHIGNIGWQQTDAVKRGEIQNLMCSTAKFSVPTQTNAVFYHQEQPLTPYVPPTPTLNISSYVHLLPKSEQFAAYKAALPQFQWKAYGASSPDGWQRSLADLYQSVSNDMFVYHVKPGGDGYGWNWHTAFIVGRPILTNFSDYKDKLGGQLFEDGVTGLDFEAHTQQENCELLTKWVNTDYFIKMGENAYNRFRSLVSYRGEQDSINQFLQRLQ